MMIIKNQSKSQNNFRVCIATQKSYPKNEMLRIARLKNYRIVIDENQKLLGKGAYFKANLKNAELIKKNKLLNRTFKTRVDLSVYEELIKYVVDHNEK